MIDHLRRFSGTLDGSTRHAYPPPKSIARARHRKARRGRSPARSGVSVSHFVSVGDGTKLCTANSVMGFPLKDSWRVNTDAEFLIGPQDAPYVQRFRNLRSRVGPRRVGPGSEPYGAGHGDVRTRRRTLVRTTRNYEVNSFLLVFRLLSVVRSLQYGSTSGHLPACPRSRGCSGSRGLQVTRGSLGLSGSSAGAPLTWRLTWLTWAGRLTLPPESKLTRHCTQHMSHNQLKLVQT